MTYLIKVPSSYCIFLLILNCLINSDINAQQKTNEKINIIKIETIKTTNLPFDASDRISTILRTLAQPTSERNQPTNLKTNLKNSYIISGTAGRINNIYVLSLVLKNQQGNIISQITNNCQCNFDSFLSKTTKDAFKALQEKIPN